MDRIRLRRSIAVAPAESATEVDLRDVLPKPRLARLRGTKTVTATLPDGRVAWLSIRPAPVSAAAINRLRRAIERADVYRATGLRSNAVAIRRLGKRVADDAGRLSRRRAKGLRNIEKKLLAGDEKNAHRIDRELKRRDREGDKTRAGLRGSLRKLKRRQLWDHLVVASSAPLFAAYGRTGDPFAPQNLTLALSLGVWLTGDEISDALSGARRRATGPKELDLWSYVAPLGNVATGWWLFSEQQQERFVTGIADMFDQHFPETPTPSPPPTPVPTDEEPLVDRPVPVQPAPLRGTFRARVPLEQVLAPGHVEDFKGFGNVPAVATLVGSEWEAAMRAARLRVGAITAEVEVGILTITVTVTGSRRALGRLPRPLPQPRVAWVVDTRELSR